MSSCEKSCGCGPVSATTEAATASSNEGTWVSSFSVPKMDCPSEERMIRLVLNGLPELNSLSFDLTSRQVRAFHDGPVDLITTKLESLGLGATLLGTQPASQEAASANSASEELTASKEASTLKILLGINAAMFVIEMGAGLIAQSAGLVADSLDMFADAAVYGLALYAVGRSARLQVRAAHLAGFFQIVLALGVLVEVARRFLYGSEPESMLMMGIGAVALVANVSCLLMIYGHREGGAHMKASWIFSANDVLANIGVIAAGALVAWTGSSYPDLVIGTIVGLIVLNGARRILALKA
ncbi:cation transporter (plasmid) [Pseudomonas fulva]|uniref:Cobalt-zinc-cadmium resistance protein CzcD n=3 Tax=Pseudomonas TaxID=286 RepID=A0A7M1HVX5_PSEPU|nr:cation diffusion facilitator family transporter [Pseudomonas fulva]QOQ30726.1 Cobalt-zinc-cadmium resistance protein CzcD [Pseudomonas putida]QPH51467.1 cation transporter [Pseudomonas fulva]WJN66768.1 Cobalt/zinc/cadmium resistance protein CzcD [Pseudomonas putida]